jgi:hypothetical protein
MSEQYNVVFKGELIEGFDLESVQSSFAQTFKVSLDKVEKYFTGQPHALRKKVDHKTAYKFKSVLEGIGASVELQKLVSKPASALDGLSLVPMEGSNNEQQVAENNVEDIVKPKSVNSLFACPKCETEQKKAVECISCGIIFDKFFARQNDVVGIPKREPKRRVVAASQATPVSETIEEEQTEVTAPNSFNNNALLASLAAALAGAFIWKFIAVAFEYELGLIAWGIGGAVGFAASKFGSRGQNAGIICAVLTFFAIFGGKYMAYDSFRTQLVETMSTASPEMNEIYDGEQAEAKLYVKNVHDEKSKRQFMVDHGYSESWEVDGVTDKEIEEFNQYSAPRLESIGADTPSFEQWIKTSFKEETESFTTFDMLKESFGFIDFLFLFFGIGTAFRLGSNEEFNK